MRIESPVEPSEMAALAAAHQMDPTTSHGYFSEEASAIAVELEELLDWPSVAFVARDQDVLGWLAADIDDDMGRVWWWGPVTNDSDVQDALYATASQAHGHRFNEEELAGDVRNRQTAAFAKRHGFVAEQSSLALELARPDFRPSGAVPSHEPNTSERLAMAVLHDELFAGTHSTGSTWMEPNDDLVLVTPGVLGYIVAQVQADGTGYIDFLGVAPDDRRKGAASSLISAACTQLWNRDVTKISLTVRANELGAQALYHGLGFVTALELVPYRRGFSLE